MWKKATPCHIFITQMWLPSYAHINFLYTKHTLYFITSFKIAQNNCIYYE